jgi:HPt (histidine-containing phosphotransfer) domain-containing protein
MDDPKFNAEPVFDPDEALAIVGGDKTLFIELTEAFRENYPRELGSIRDAIWLRDADALKRASHHFKSTLGAVAAGPACQTVALLEEIALRSSMDEAEAAYTRIEQQVRALDAALSNWS